MFNQSGSRRWTHFHSALQLAVQRSARKWTFDDFAECFPLYVQEDKNSALATFTSISDYIESQTINDLDKLFTDYNVHENIDILHKIVTDAKDRKARGETRKDAWREDLNPRIAVGAKTTPILEKEILRLKQQLAEREKLNSQLQADLEAATRQTDEINARALEMVEQVDKAQEEWENLPQEDIEAWSVHMAETLKPAVRG
ncbi:hypothetical protein FA15DRAFT_674851 [Coprinopsis marcescibilis]|uniref:Nnf1-domain-containing protein n=1 Tax=Coprinopsis marcescibilis TaxID=230819 RepID=A0A5C3KGC1_COPMA|nr:hypothetical protein FA15DRAFT_674851 [Coprinopsis marcescibilis]